MEGRMITVEQFREPCGCRSVGECNHNLTVELSALNACVDSFAHAMKEKLMRKWMRDGKAGWDDPEWRDHIRESLTRHVEKGDMVDVANLAMMLWNFKQP